MTEVPRHFHHGDAEYHQSARRSGPEFDVSYQRKVILL
jgi:hypothetical protein